MGESKITLVTNNMNSVKISSVEKFKREYEGVCSLGVGGFGSVHLVENRKGVKRAVKLIMISNVRFKIMARREAQILLQLKECEGIVEGIEYFEDRANGLLVTEYLAGGELFARCSRREYKLSEEKCKVFTRSLIKALDYIHTNNVVHLDLKPANIMFHARGSEVLKIIDFGLARQLPSYGRVATMNVGTVGFMAPEVAKCIHASPASDMWSLGVVVFMMVSGGLEPFWYKNSVCTQRRVKRGEFEFNHRAFSKVSNEAKEFITSLLSVRPCKRMNASEALNHPWLQETVVITPILDTCPMRKYLARRRWIKAIMAVRAVQRIKWMSSSNNTSEGMVMKLQKILDNLESLNGI